MPTRARSATSSSGAEVPLSVKSARAAATSLSRFARASARMGRCGWISDCWLNRFDNRRWPPYLIRRFPPGVSEMASTLPQVWFEGGIGMQEAQPTSPQATEGSAVRALGAQRLDLDDSRAERAVPRRRRDMRQGP